MTPTPPFIICALAPEAGTDAVRPSHPPPISFLVPFRLALALATVFSLLLVAHPAAAGEAASEPSRAVPPQARVHFEAGFALQKQQQTNEALARYEQALALDPNYVAALYEIGWSFWMLERWDDVVRVWKRALEIEPNHPEIPDYLSEAELNLKLTTAPKAETHRETLAAAASPARIASGDEITLTFAGDVAYPEGWGGIGTIKAQGKALFGQVRAITSDAELNFVNLECPFTQREATVDKKYPITCAPERLDYILDSGFNLFSLANNHTMDAGRAGADDTLSLMRAKSNERRPLWWAGVNPAEGATPPYDLVVVPGSDLRIGFIALANGRGMTGIASKTVPERLAKAAADTDFVIVSVHSGREYRHVPGKTRSAQFRSLIDAGADLVIGHHPHVVQGVERHGQGVIFHSLGNFSFGSKTRRHLDRGARLYSMMGRVTLRGSAIAAVELIPLYVNNSRPWTLDDRTLPSRHASPQLLSGTFAGAALDEIETFTAALPGASSTSLTRVGDRLFVDLGGPPLSNDELEGQLSKQAAEYQAALAAGGGTRPATDKEKARANIAGTPANVVPKAAGGSRED